MKRSVFSLLLVLVLILAGGATLFAGGSKEQPGGATASASPTELVLWTFQEIHLGFYKDMVQKWNSANPTRQVSLNGQAYPYDDMHNKLLIALQSGVGAPDIADIEISKFPNYMKGNIQLASMNDKVEPVLNDMVKARLDIYSKDGTYYGLPFHVGATVAYYNMDIMNAAGVDIDNIRTWDDYVKAGQQVVAKTGKPMTTLEVTDQWSYWPMISQQGSDYLDKDGNVILDNAINIKTLQFQHDMIYKYKIAIPTPGGFHHSEEYYGFMNKGGAASIIMPFWYMGRFTDYMPDLKGKIAIRPMPSFGPNGFRSAGMGGTGTVVTKQSKHLELAKDFLAYAKLSKEGNIMIWKDLGFDPPRWSVWSDPATHEPNKFSEYFQNGTKVFDEVIKVKDEINPVHVFSKLPDVITAVKTTVLFQALKDQSKTPEQSLKDAAAQLRK